mmetsp:Transcript_17061/g.66465  ORF Transcript_17061/g.66465 Transcript_17061/m.66465 type:complete len:216 (-) Transcript_17061:85-732(-)
MNSTLMTPISRLLTVMNTGPSRVCSRRAWRRSSRRPLWWREPRPSVCFSWCLPRSLLFSESGGKSVTPWTSSTMSAHCAGMVHSASRMITLPVNLHWKAESSASSALATSMGVATHLTASFDRTRPHSPRPCSSSQARNSATRSWSGAMRPASSSGVRYWPYSLDLGLLTSLTMRSSSGRFCCTRENQSTCCWGAAMALSNGFHRPATGRCPWPS